VAVWLPILRAGTALFPFWYSFTPELSKTRGLVRPEGLDKLTKIIHFIGSRIRDPPSCSAMTLPLRYRVPPYIYTYAILIGSQNYLQIMKHVHKNRRSLNWTVYLEVLTYDSPGISAWRPSWGLQTLKWSQYTEKQQFEMSLGCSAPPRRVKFPRTILAALGSARN
jgi:hypothetical protein